MLNIFLCEDNESQRNLIENYIEKTITIEDYDIHLRCSTGNPNDILEYIKQHKQVGLYFLDIDLNNDMNGLMLAQNIRQYDPRGFIVFVTTHFEMSYMTFSYQVEAMDFIIKDKPEELHDRIHQCIINAYSRFSSKNNLSHRVFSVKFPDSEMNIPYDDIIFFETAPSHTLVLHTTDSVIEFYGVLRDIEQNLDKRFFRSHRSYIINKDHIETIHPKNKTIVMSNGEICLISSKQIKELLK